MTFSTGVTEGLDVADGLDEELGGGLVLLGLKFELGEGLDGWLDALPATEVTVGEIESRAVKLEQTLKCSCWARRLGRRLGRVRRPRPGGHVCVGQVTMGLRVTLLLECLSGA